MVIFPYMGMYLLNRNTYSKSEYRYGKAICDFILPLNTSFCSIWHNKGDIRNLRKFPFMVNNFVMRYPDSFGQRRKKLANDLVCIIFQSWWNPSSGFWDIATQSFFLIWAYCKSQKRNVSQSLICTASK